MRQLRERSHFLHTGMHSATTQTAKGLRTGKAGVAATQAQGEITATNEAEYKSAFYSNTRCALARSSATTSTQASPSLRAVCLRPKLC